jgi:hypothetical protein
MGAFLFVRRFTVVATKSAMHGSLDPEEVDR